MLSPSIVLVLKVIEVLKIVVLVILEDTVEYREDTAYRYILIEVVKWIITVGSIIYIRTIESTTMGMPASAV